MPSNTTARFAVFFLFFFGLALVFWPALGGQKIFNDNYASNYAVGQTGYNFYKDFGNSLRQGHWQLWWPSYMAGFPVYLTQVGFFNPLGILLFRFLDYVLAYNWLIFFNFLFAGLATYWLARNLKLSRPAAILAGFAWTLSLNNIHYGSIPILSVPFVFIPLFLGAILKLSEGNRKYLFWGGLIAAYGLIAGFITVVFFTFIAALAWALFLDWPRFFGKALRGYILISTIGAFLASFWLLPVINYLSATLRSGAVSSSVFYDYLRIGDILRFFYPFIRLPAFTDFTFSSGMANLYIGIVPLFLAIIAVFLWRRDKFIAFWLGLFLFGFSMRLWFFPIFQWTQYLPLFDRFKGPFHWYSLAFFSLAILSAYGLDYLKDIKEERWFKNFVKSIGIFAAVNFLFVLVGNIIFKFWSSNILRTILDYFDKYYFSGKKLPIEHYHAVIIKVLNDGVASVSVLNYQFFVSFVFILVGAILFIFYQKNYINFNKFKILAAAISILNLVLIWQDYYNFTPRQLIENSPDTIQFIKSRADSENTRAYRFYPPEMYQEFRMSGLQESQDYDLKTLGHQTSPYFFDGFSGGEPFRSSRIAQVLDEIGYEAPSNYLHPVWMRSDNLTLTDKISRFSSSKNRALLSMLNIKYIFSSFKLPNFKLIYETIATEKNIPVYIYENLEVLPRIYFAKDVRFIDSKSAFEELLKVKDFRETTLIEAPKSDFKSPASGDFEVGFQVPESDFEILEFKPQFVKLKTSGGGWLVYGDANLPTWEAYIDGQRMEIHTANYLFKSVFVPEGEREVIFEYPGLKKQFKYAVKNIF